MCNSSWNCGLSRKHATTCFTTNGVKLAVPNTAIATLAAKQWPLPRTASVVIGLPSVSPAEPSICCLEGTILPSVVSKSERLAFLLCSLICLSFSFSLACAISVW